MSLWRISVAGLRRAYQRGRGLLNEMLCTNCDRFSLKGMKAVEGRHFTTRSSAMNKMIALTLFAVAWTLSSGATPSLSSPAAHSQTVQYAVPPVPVMTVCNVNGVGSSLGNFGEESADAGRLPIPDPSVTDRCKGLQMRCVPLFLERFIC